MGSFNTTCFASGQTIAPHDRARILAVIQKATYDVVEMSVRGQEVAQHGFANSSCYPDCFWAPVTAFLPARYDDYGHFELTLETPVQRRNVLNFFVFLLFRGAKVKQGKNASHDVAVDFEAFLQEEAPALVPVLAGRRPFLEEVDKDVTGLETEIAAAWHYVTTAVQENRLFALNYNQVLRPVTFAVMHEEAYQELIAIGENTPNWKKESNKLEDFVRRKVDSSRSEMMDFTQKLSEGDPQKAELARIEAALSQMFFFAERLSGELRSIGGSEGSHFSRAMLDETLRKYAGALLEGQVSPEFIEAVRPHMHDLYAYGTLEELNLRISPMVYAGQDYDNSIGQAYAGFVQNVCNKVTAGRRDED